MIEHEAPGGPTMAEPTEKARALLDAPGYAVSGWPQPGDWRRAEQREQLQVGQVVVVHIYHGAHYGYVEKIGRTRVQVLVQMRTHRSARLRSFAITDVWISWERRGCFAIAEQVRAHFRQAAKRG